MSKNNYKENASDKSRDKDDFKKCISEDLNNNNKFDEFIVQMANSQEKPPSLICFVGAGTSISQGYAPWNKYVEELIEFWKSHLNVLTQSSDTFYDRVEATDVAMLDWLKKQNFDNKRKVDIVNYIVKRYCALKNSRKSINEELYKEHVNDFEKSYFIEMDPVNSENLILNKLVKLSGLFITTNYDNQIEEAYHKVFQRKAEVIEDITRVPKEGRLPNMSVIHLHGTPISKNVLLVSSATSYNKLYFDNPEYRKKLLGQIYDKTNPLLLFVGSSLQEEEILHYLKSRSNDKLKKYALMKYDFSNGKIGRHEARILENYYEEEKQIRIIWYGKKYEDLPVFLDFMNERIDKEIKRRNKIITDDDLYNSLRNDSEENFEKLFSKSIKNQDPFFIDALFKNDLSSSELDKIMKNTDFVNSLENGTSYFDFWKQIDNDYKKYNDKQKQTILNLIQKNASTVVNATNILHILSKETRKLKRGIRFNTFYKYARKYLKNYMFPAKLSNNLEKCAWLIANFEDNSINSQIDLSVKTSFRMFNVPLRMLLAKLNKIYYGSEYKLLIDSAYDRRVKVLSSLIKNRKLKYMQNHFPAIFYKNKLIQRILINLALNKELPKVHFAKLKKYFSKNTRDMGKETNEFVRKFMPEVYKDKGANYYFDGVHFGNFEKVEYKPFYTMYSPRNKTDISKLIHNLYSALSKKEDFEHNLTGQNTELVNVFTKEQNWIKNKNANLGFLKKLITNKDLLQGYIWAINRIIIFIINNNILLEDDIKILNLYFNNISNSSWIFQSENNELIEYLLKTKNKTKCVEILRNFMFTKVNIKESDFYSKKLKSQNKNWIDFNNFVNTFVFNYFRSVITIQSNYPQLFNKEWKNLFIEKINKLKDKERQYSKGIFYWLFSKFNSNDPDLKTIHCFIGFSQIGYSISVNTSLQFKDAVQQLLNSDFDDNYCMNNIAREMILEVSPHIADISVEVDNSEYLKNLIQLIIRYYLKSKLPNRNYVFNWIEWSLKNDSAIIAQLVCNDIVYYIEYEKTSYLLSVINKNKIGINSIQLNYKYFDTKKTYDRNCLERLVKLVKILDEKGALKADSSVVNAFQSYLEELSRTQNKDLNKDLLEVSKKYLPSYIQKDFEEKYL